VTPHDDHGERLLTSDEAASIANVKPVSWYRIVARGSAPAPDGHVGRTPVWRESTVIAWLDKRRGE
jgi:predicted DNA-binding transcriptional regulator AlpA